jgi:hypothetical protein
MTIRNELIEDSLADQDLSSVLRQYGRLWRAPGLPVYLE